MASTAGRWGISGGDGVAGAARAASSAQRGAAETQRGRTRCDGRPGPSRSGESTCFAHASAAAVRRDRGGQRRAAGCLAMRRNITATAGTVTFLNRGASSLFLDAPAPRPPQGRQGGGIFLLARRQQQRLLFLVVMMDMILAIF